MLAISSRIESRLVKRCIGASVSRSARAGNRLSGPSRLAGQGRSREGPACYSAKEVSTAIMRSLDMQPCSGAIIRSAPAVALASI